MPSRRAKVESDLLRELEQARERLVSTLDNKKVHPEALEAYALALQRFTNYILHGKWPDEETSDHPQQ